MNLTAIPDDGQVTLTWTVPATDGGSPITTYQVSKDNGESWTDVGLDTSYTFTGLTNGTEYTFKVRAVNSEGPGEAASITAVPIMTYPPDAPQNFTATPGYRQAVLSWDPPASDGGTPIIKYQLSKDNGESWTDVHKDLTTYTFINLTNGIEYTFKVRAVNNKGPGAEASATAIPAAPVPSQKGIYAWGVNSYGQLGDGSLVNKDFPTHIGTNDDWADWTMISAGYRHTAALQADGSLWTWGSNSNGQLGISSDELRMNHPVQVGSDTDWVAVDAGYDFTVALKADGSLWAWGYATGGFEYGGFSIDWNVPTLVDNENKWIAVSAGSGHTVAIREDGTLWGWGFNARGELGSSGFDDYIDYTESPVQISSDRWIAVSAGDYFTIGLKEDGSLWAWGENDVGQLGNGSTENTSVPTRVGSEGDSWLAAETAPGSDHVVAIKADGSLWAWGGNEYGQLGRGYKDGVHQNPPPHPVPQQIGTDTDWVSVVAGMNLSAALKSDGSLWLWGIIGIDMEGANEPQRLEADGTWLGVACGSTYALAILQGGSTVPGAPQNFTAIPGDGQVTLSWTAPASDGGSAIIRYEVSSDGGDTWTSVGTSTTHTFTGLTNGTEYTFKVRAVNNVGYGYAASVTAVPVAAPSGDFAGGSGTEDSPYLISTVTHLDNVRNYLDKHFRLTADLELSDFTSGLGWEPFGTEEEPFTGTLDGAGHTISNLTIAHDSESMAAGLFAYTGETAEIRDLGLVSVSVSGSYNVGGLVGENYGKITGSYVIGNVTGFFGVGGLVGNNHGSISNSWAEGTVKDIDKVSGYYYGGLVGENANDSTISNCYANVTVNSPHSTTVGGLVGDNLGSITDSFAVGAVEAGTSAGGLVGSNSGYIEKCYATGNVVSKTIAGGLVAYNYRSINQSYATGNVSGKGQTGGLAGGNSGSIFNSYARGAVSGDEFIGGLVGFNIDSITNCYSTGAVSGKSYTGGLVGLNDTKSGSVINCYWDKETSGKSSSDGGTGKKTAEMKQQETYENWNFDALWGINTDNDGYPFLIWQVDENALTVPGVPRDFSATPGNGLMELSWIPPASDGGSEITHYEVFCDNEGTWVVADTNSSHTFTGLENGTMYTFKVRAVNSAGTGPEASLMATPEATVTKPSAPQNLSIDAGDEEALLRWEAPASDGGSAITHYEVSIDGIIWATAMSNNFHVFIDLINGVEYTFYVRAVNSVGAGPAASITATPATRPSAPQNLTATPGDGQVTLSWDAPASDGGAEITKYQVSIDVENWIDVDVDTTTYTFTGLTNGEEFTFYVRAVNRVGEGEWEIVTATPEAELVITHTINFYSNGSLYASRTVASGYALEDDWPDNPIRSGYSFRGWFTEENGSGTAYTRETNITEDVTLYAYWTYIGGSSGGGSTTTPSTPAEQEEIETETETTFQISISGNVGTIIIDEDPWQTAAEEDITITVPSASGVSTYSIDMSMSILSKTDDLGSLTISTDIGSITVQSNMLTDVAGAEGDKAQITFGLGDKSSLPEDVRDRIGDRPLIQLSLSIDGQQTSWNNPDAPVKVSIPYTPTEEELSNPESIVVWYIDGSGNVVTVPNGHYDPATGTVTFYTTHFSDFAVAYNKVSFKDVPEDAWYNKAVSFIAARGITEGTGNDHFSPELNLKRGEFLVLMMRAYGIAPDEKPTGNFSDAGNTYYTGYLAAAKRLGISAGVGNNRFAPEKEITRQEMFTMLYNALKVIGQLPKGDSGRTMFDFSDASEIASWAKEAMAHFVRTGTVSGSAGKLSPADTATRAEMAQLLHNLLAN